MAADKGRRKAQKRQQKALNAPFWSSAQEKTKAASNFGKLILIKLLPPSPTTGKRALRQQMSAAKSKARLKKLLP